MDFIDWDEKKKLIFYSLEVGYFILMEIKGVEIWGL